MDKKPIFNKITIGNLRTTDQVYELNDLYQIEDFAISIKELKDKNDFYKNYKKEKMKDINDAIKVNNNKIDFLKAIIRETIKNKSDTKTVHFPGTGKITIKKNKDKWECQDEDAVIQYFSKKYPDSKVIKEKKEIKINKKELDKNLDAMEKNGEIEEVKDFVIKEEREDSVAIKWDKDYSKDVEDVDNIQIEVPIKDTEEDLETKIPVKDVESDINTDPDDTDFDTLDF